MKTLFLALASLFLINTAHAASDVQNDPCVSDLKTSVPISQTSNTKLITATTGKKVWICSFMVVGSDAENISVVQGTGSTCGTSTAALIGAATAAAGPNLAANGGFAIGTGRASIAISAAAKDICLFQSGGGRVAGVMTYVAQ